MACTQQVRLLLYVLHALVAVTLVAVFYLTHPDTTFIAAHGWLLDVLWPAGTGQQSFFSSTQRLQL
jgi:hypothetical protein